MVNHPSRLVTLALLFVLFLILPTASAEQQTAPIVAVFDLQDHSGQLAPRLLLQLKAYLRAKLSEGGVFQVVPEGQMRGRLRQQKKDSYKHCYDEKCQIELGRELAAQKSLSTQIAKVGSQCVVMSALYDLRRSTAERSASHKTGCSQTQLIEAVEHIAAALRPKRIAAAAPARPTGGLILRSEPVGATVWLDGKQRGKTPLTLINIAPGKHQVKLTSRYHEQRATVVVQADRMSDQRIKMSLNAAGQAREQARRAAELQRQQLRQQRREAVAARRRSGSRWGYSLLGGSLAALATAGVLYGVGIPMVNDGDDLYGDARFRSDMDDGRDKIETARPMIYTAIGLTVAGVITLGVALKVLGSRPAEPPADEQRAGWTRAASCGPLPGGLGCSLGGRF